MRVRLPIAVALLAASTALVGCGGSGGGSSASDGGAATTAAPTGGGGSGDAVTIADFAFDPDALEVRVGDTVTFANEDDAAHTATADEGDPVAFDTGDIPGGSSKEVTFDEAGEYAYSCSIHEYMKGTVRVLE